MARRPTVDPSSASEIGKRLRRSREALGYTTTKMCELMGSATSGSAYTNYEMGRRRISLDHALALRRECGLTLEWIYCGVIKDLPEHLQQALQQSSPPARSSSPMLRRAPPLRTSSLQ